MTNPNPLATEDGALDNLSRLATGNENVVARPNLMTALVNGQASPADVSVVNTFVGALQAENAVSRIRLSGNKAYLPPSMVQSLQAIGANYSDVYQTQAQQQQAAQAASVKKITDQGMMPVYNKGTLIGARQKTSQEQNAGGDGWFDSFGGFFHHLTHNPVTNVIGEGYNLAQTGVSDIYQATHWDATDPSGQASSADNEANNKIMQSLGYDPNSNISNMAADAKGIKRTNLTYVVAQYGMDRVVAAADYLHDPKGYVQTAIAAANAKDPTGVQAQQVMEHINSKQFGDLLQEMQGHSSSIGSDIAYSSGLDPVKNPSAYKWTQGGIDFAASFALDPTLAALKVARVIKMSQIGIAGLADTQKMGRILDLSNKGMYARQVQRGMQDAVANGNLIREGTAAADAARAAGDLKGFAKAQAQVAQGGAGLKRLGLWELAPALTGTHRVVGLDEANPGMLKFAEGGEPLDTYDKLAQYITSTQGMLALQSGKAAVQSSLMPGAMSAFGAKYIRGALAGATAGRKTAYNFKKLEAASKLLPTPADAVDVTSMEHLAQAGADTAPGMASAARAANFPSDAQLGEAEYNMRRYGNFEGRGFLGSMSFQVPKLGEVTPGSWLNPKALAARAKLAATRLNMTNVLPRNNRINLLDEQAPDKVLAFARLYLPKDQSMMLAASYAAGDFGARRAILQGLKAQVFHSAGLYHSESGTELADRFLMDDKSLYTHAENGIMPVDPWTGEKDLSSAVWANQNAIEYAIPSFGQMHTVAAKLGMYESMVGRAMTSHLADTFGSMIRYLMLASPRTAVRATVEGWFNQLMRGGALKALAAKARMAELDAEEHAFLPARGWALTKATGWFLPRAVGHAIKGIEKRGMTEQELMYLERVHEHAPEIAHQVQDSMSQHLLKGDVSPLRESADMLGIARAGLNPKRLDGWAAKSTEDWEGAHHLENALLLRQTGNPKTFPAILDHIANPSTDSMNRVKDAMLDPVEYDQFRRMRWVNTYRDNQGNLTRAITEDQKQIAFEQHADRMVADLRALVTGQDGQLSPKLMDKLQSGEMPNQKWINDTLRNEERPAAAIAPNYVPKVVEDADTAPTARQKIAAVTQDLSGKGYKKLVADPAERMTSMPIFWTNYVQSRVEMAPLEAKLIEEGHYTADTAEQLLMHRAIRQAWVKTEYTVDDPGLKTQFDIVGRNLVAFPRAVNAFLRRYGNLVKQDPAVIRKAFLGIQGAEHMGFVYTDEHGELTYTVPGSGFFVNALNELGRMLGHYNIVQIPQGDLTGKVLMSAPGFDNPIRMSMSPMLNIPFRFIANLFPDHRMMFAEIDGVLNGSKGSGRSWESELMPAALSHLYEAMTPDDRNGVLSSATMGAYANMVAADPNGDLGILPKPGSDPSGAQMQKVLGTLKVQVKNQLYLRWALGLFLPSSPSRPSDESSGSHPDEAYFIRGARGLDSEFKMMVDDYKGDYVAAMQAFVALHPNGLVYTIPKSTVTAAGLNLPATRQSETWMEQHMDLINKFPLVSAYFAPKSQGKFDANAWQAQEATGLRQNKSVDEFVQSYELKQSQTIYFNAYHQMKEAQAQAVAAGDTKRARFLSTNFTDQMQPFLAANPVLRAWLTVGDAEKAVSAQKAIGQLRDLIGTKEAANLPNIGQVSQMLQAWDVHEGYQHQHMVHDAHARAYEKTTFAQFMEDKVTNNPDLLGLYNVFRAVDYASLPSLAQVTQTGEVA